MKQRSRKFVGVWLILALLVAYPLVVIVAFTTYLLDMHVWASIIFFLVLGLTWAIPAGLIIKWMSKPDAPVPLDS